MKLLADDTLSVVSEITEHQPLSRARASNARIKRN